MFKYNQLYKINNSFSLFINKLALNGDILVFRFFNSINFSINYQNKDGLIFYFKKHKDDGDIKEMNMSELSLIHKYEIIKEVFRNEY